MLPEGRVLSAALEKDRHGVRRRRTIIGIKMIARYPVLDDFSRAAVACCKNRQPRSHCLNNGQPECLEAGRLNEYSATVGNMPIQFARKVFFKTRAEPTHAPLQLILVHNGVHVMDLGTLLIV